GDEGLDQGGKDIPRTLLCRPAGSPASREGDRQAGREGRSRRLGWERLAEAARSDPHVLGTSTWGGTLRAELDGALQSGRSGWSIAPSISTPSTTMGFLL